MYKASQSIGESVNFDIANLTNLTSLWQQYGAHTLSLPHGEHIYLNHSWPHRCWMIPGTTMPHQFDDWLSSLPEQTILPVYASKRSLSDNPLLTLSTEEEQQLLALGWQCQFEQTAMYLSDTSPLKMDKDSQLSFSSVTNLESLSDWVAVSSAAFGYEIAPAVIQALMNEPMVELILGRRKGAAICCALLYKTGDIVGLHQMSVLPQWQGQGVAQQLMHNLLEKAQHWQSRALVLQASAAGLPLYTKLGFLPQFHIKNYQFCREQKG